MTIRQVDVLVVGGGIHGVGCAQAAAAAGHSVLLLEQRALAAGSSSRSSKLIEAGMRSPHSLGAELCMPAHFVAAELTAAGVVARWREGERELECQAKVLINAAGPWAAQIARAVAPAIEVPKLELVQGTHVVLD